MPTTELPAADVSINGPGTQLWALAADECRALRTHRIARLGVDEATMPYRRVRIRPGGSFVLISVSGGARVFLDGHWQEIAGDVACMAPPRVLNVFEAASPEPWKFFWVRYQEPPQGKSCVTADLPVRARCAAGPILRLFDGLRAEVESANDARLVAHWIELIHGHVRRLAQPWDSNERLGKLWRSVGERLAEDWTLSALAKSSHMSQEHLRRLCQLELGRSPMQHLAVLRLRRGRELLESTEDKLETIAREIGYESAQVFSRAFKRWAGCSPPDYRR